MTQKDIDWVFEWTQVVLEQAKWCNKVGKEKVMEMTRQALEDWTDELIIPCGSSWGAIFERGCQFYDDMKKRDKELKEEYFKNIKPFDKYWVMHGR